MESCYAAAYANRGDDAIERGDMEGLQDELGDLLFQVVFHAALREREGSFDLDDVIVAIRSKMLRRHPHVFGEDELTDPTTESVIDKVKDLET